MLVHLCSSQYILYEIIGFTTSEVPVFANWVIDVYKGADIQGFPSASEGFSLAIADAMAMGIPHIGFSNAHSVNELIVDGHNGFLADDLDEFAEKLKTLMSDKELRVKMGENARNDMKEYAPENIISQWNELLKETVSPK